ncbi:hydroxymethylpyrimidine/phosphomethylpyrimidine kinase [Lachnospiraceae bacterium 46-15]
MMNKKVLTIAGSDSSGGAGIQADLKVMCAYGVYGMSVITAVTAQNTLGVQQVEELPPEVVAAQLSSVLEDIRPDAVKIGMVYSRENVEVIGEAVERWGLENVVLDPVMVSSSGRELLRPDAAEAMQEILFPKVTLVTPNVPEAGKLAGFLKDSLAKEEVQDCRKPIKLLGGIEKGQDRDAGCQEQVTEISGKERGGGSVFWTESIARIFSERWHTAFLIKGGHRKDAPADYLYDGEKGVWFPGRRVETRHTHGTGCTLSSAVACNLAKGYSLEESVREAKIYLTGCLENSPGIGHGHGALNHLWKMEIENGKR